MAITGHFLLAAVRCPAEIEQVTDPGADPLVTCTVCDWPSKVRSTAVGSNMPLPPDEKVRCATFHVLGFWAFPLLTRNVPVWPFPQWNIPDNAAGALPHTPHGATIVMLSVTKLVSQVVVGAAGSSS
jgi:hypothetical protein